MNYYKNGKKVTKQEFSKNKKGFDFSKGFCGVSGFTCFRSPVDGKMITNTADLEAHNRYHNVQQVGHEYENKLNEIRENRG